MSKWNDTVLVMLTIITVMAGMTIFYYLSTFVLKIVNCFRERDYLREQLEGNKVIYTRNGQRAMDALDELGKLRKNYDLLRVAYESDKDEKYQIITEYENRLDCKQKEIEALRNQILLNAEQYQKKTAKKQKGEEE